MKDKLNGSNKKRNKSEMFIIIGIFLTAAGTLTSSIEGYEYISMAILIISVIILFIGIMKSVKGSANKKD